MFSFLPNHFTNKLLLVKWQVIQDNVLRELESAEKTD